MRMNNKSVLFEELGVEIHIILLQNEKRNLIKNA